MPKIDPESSPVTFGVDPAARVDFAVRLPRLFEQQRKIREHPAKRKVINAGRRGGKTTLAADIAAEALLDGKQVLYAAPVAKQTDAFWRKCKRYLAEGIRAGKLEKKETNRTLSFPASGGEIRCQTAYDADTMRSGEADLLILDEWALMAVDAWDKVGAPMLADRNGDALFISTPCRRNHHFEFFQRGLADGERWASFVYPSTANPYLSAEALADLAADMTEDAYRQEILAEFLENEGAVFRKLDACLKAPAARPEDHAGHWIVAGVDLAKQHDFTAVHIGCATCHVELATDRFNKVDYLFQVKLFRSIFEKWHVAYALVDSTGVGDPIVEMLQRDLSL